MSMTEAEKQRIKDEEYFRDQVRKSLKDDKPPSGWAEKLSAFFETKAGFWLLTTFLAGLVATAFSAIQTYVSRADLEDRRKQENARRDTELLLKFAPMMASEKPIEWKLAIRLLNGLGSAKGVDQRIADDVTNIFTAALEIGNAKDAPQPMRDRATQILLVSDSPGKMDIETGEQMIINKSPSLFGSGAMEARPSILTLPVSALPLRVYIQIKQDEALRSTAEKTKEALEQAGVIVPGIELVREANFSENDLRYCRDKVSEQDVHLISIALASVVEPNPKLIQLSDLQCVRVRPRHLELRLTKS